MNADLCPHCSRPLPTWEPCRTCTPRMSPGWAWTVIVAFLAAYVLATAATQTAPERPTQQVRR
jgi:hypothetical protein